MNSLITGGVTYFTRIANPVFYVRRMKEPPPRSKFLPVAKKGELGINEVARRNSAAVANVKRISKEQAVFKTIEMIPLIIESLCT